MATILITGASGAVGTGIRPLLAHHTLRLADVSSLPSGPASHETFAQVGVENRDELVALATGADLIVHLAGTIENRALPDLIGTNVLGVYHMLEAAVAAGVNRILNASTNHVVGFGPTDAAGTTAPLLVRPDGTYGASKAMGEAVASLYADNHGLTVVSARILTFLPVPKAVRHLATWLSPKDFVRLIDAVSILDRPGHHVLWGVSRNARRWASLAEGEAIGYRPEDDAERYFDSILSEGPEADARSLAWIGGRKPPRVA